MADFPHQGPDPQFPHRPESVAFGQISALFREQDKGKEPTDFLTAEEIDALVYASEQRYGTVMATMRAMGMVTDSKIFIASLYIDAFVAGNRYKRE